MAPRGSWSGAVHRVADITVAAIFFSLRSCRMGKVSAWVTPVMSRNSSETKLADRPRAKWKIFPFIHKLLVVYSCPNSILLRVGQPSSQHRCQRRAKCTYRNFFRVYVPYPLVKQCELRNWLWNFKEKAFFRGIHRLCLVAYDARRTGESAPTVHVCATRNIEVYSTKKAFSLKLFPSKQIWSWLWIYFSSYSIL